jgi:uncharacterized protein YbaA (DUF1428 family)
MHYIDGFVAPVLLENREAYRLYAEKHATVFKDVGALNVVECWEDDVPDGVMTSFPRAIMKQDNEAVVFSWVTWPSKAVRDAGWAKIMADESMEPGTMPFDGKRMIYGGFQMIVDA